MKINRSQINTIANLYKIYEKEEKDVKEKSLAPAQDEVILSEEGQRLQATTKGETKNERAKRVEEVKTLIKKGKYHVDSKLLAEKMIQKALDKKKV